MSGVVSGAQTGRAVERPYDTVKRSVDIVVSAALLAVLSPVLLVVALLVRRRLGSPVLFRQQRPGRDGKPFLLVKLRTMLDVDEAKGLVTNEQRLTPFGRRLRATSLDELPSLWNVLRGDMSLVGPRPLRMDYLVRYTPRQARRHEVRPGVTGLAQVSGRNLLDWDRRFELDVAYVERRSAALDLRILVETVAQVLRREGIEGDATAAMSAFMGADTSGLLENPLSPEWLETRVAWLRDERVSRGVSLSFVPTVDGMHTWWATACQDESRRDWVYTEAGRPIAMCGLSSVGTPDPSLYLYVNPDLLGRGYGSRSLQKLIRRAKSFGAHRLHLEVKEANAAAVALYRRYGFAEEDLAEPAAGKLGMVLDLRSPSAGERVGSA